MTSSADLAHPQRLWHLLILLGAHPARPALWFDPLHQLIMLAQPFEPSTPGSADLPFAPGAAMAAKVDDLALVHAKDAQYASAHQHSRMPEGAESAIAQEHVAGAQQWMQARHAGLFADVLRTGDHFDEQPRCGVEQSQQLHPWKPTTGPLLVGLREGLLKRSGVRQG